MAKLEHIKEGLHEVAVGTVCVFGCTTLFALWWWFVRWLLTVLKLDFWRW